MVAMEGYCETIVFDTDQNSECNRNARHQTDRNGLDLGALCQIGASHHHFSHSTLS